MKTIKAMLQYIIFFQFFFLPHFLMHAQAHQHQNWQDWLEEDGSDLFQNWLEKDGSDLFQNWLKNDGNDVFALLESIEKVEDAVEIGGKKGAQILAQILDQLVKEETNSNLNFFLKEIFLSPSTLGKVMQIIATAEFDGTELDDKKEEGVRIAAVYLGRLAELLTMELFLGDTHRNKSESVNKNVVVDLLKLVVKAHVALAAGKIGEKEGAQILNQLVDDSEPFLRPIVALAAGKIGGKEGAQILTQILDQLIEEDSSPDLNSFVREVFFSLSFTLTLREVKQAILTWLEIIGIELYGKEDIQILIEDPSSLDRLIELLKDINVVDPWKLLVKVAVVGVAAKMGVEEGAQILNRLVEDRDPIVRALVAAAAGHHGGEKGAQILDRLIKDSDNLVRETAVWVLEVLGVLEENTP